MKHHSGVSPILGVMILIGIALAAGVMLNNISFQFLGSALSEIEYQVTELKMQKDSTDSCYLFISLYNSGSKQIKSTLLEMQFDNGTSFFPINSTSIIEPSSTLEHFEQLKGFNCGNFTTGSSYSVSIHASSSDDSSFATTDLVTVKGISKT